MPKNQACNRLYSDKVSKIFNFGSISNIARSLVAEALKGKYLFTVPSY